MHLYNYIQEDYVHNTMYVEMMFCWPRVPILFVVRKLCYEMLTVAMRSSMQDCSTAHCGHLCDLHGGRWNILLPHCKQCPTHNKKEFKKH